MYLEPSSSSDDTHPASSTEEKVDQQVRFENPVVSTVVSPPTPPRPPTTRSMARNMQQKHHFDILQRLHESTDALQHLLNSPEASDQEGKQHTDEDEIVFEDDGNICLFDVAFVSAITSGYLEPKTFQEAWHHPDPEQRENWREAIRKEFRDMIRRGVWRYKKKSSVPSDRRLIGAKWVFKVKKNGVYRARLVALGYSQFPGVDFSENFAPVVNDVTFRIVILLWLINKWDDRIIDVETAFLNAKLDEEIYMKLPPGIIEVMTELQLDPDEDCCILDQSIYGLVQAARLWWKEFIAFLTSDEVGFEKCLIDQCLLIRTNHLGVCILCVYVDDVCCVGDKGAIDDAISKIKGKWNIKELLSILKGT